VLWPDLQSPGASAETLVAQLQTLAQTLAPLATAAAPPQLWLVLAADASPGEASLAGALRGWCRTAALEQPGLSWTLLETPAAPQDQPGHGDWPLIWAAARHEACLAWRQGRLWGWRLEPLNQERYRWATSSPGSLESLVRRPLPPEPPAPGELEIAVEATGLNFRDVLNALGLLQAYGAQLGLHDAAQLPFGGECVGRVVAVGPGVAPERIGQRVLAALAGPTGGAAAAGTQP
jgi:hypothetical protein